MKRRGSCVTQPRRANGGPILELTDVHTYYGSIHALKGISLDVREGEIVTLLGANGAGKSTTLRSINGLNRPRQGSIRFQGRDITEVAGARDRQARHRPVAGGAAAVPADDRDREPRDGRVPAHGPGGDPGGHGPRLRPLPAPEGAAQPEGRDDVRRRAADVRDRPRADGAAEAAAARRAVARPRADLRRAHLRDRQDDQRAGHLDPARRAERADGARRSQPRLRAGDRADRPRRPRPRR